MQVLSWFGGTSGNLALAAAFFGVAAYMIAELEDAPVLKQTLTYTSSDQVNNILSYLPFGGYAKIDVNLRTLLIFFLVVTGCFHLLYALLGPAGARFRFIEYLITATCMFVILQVLSGERNADVVASCAALMASTMLFGFLQDRATFSGDAQLGLPYLFGWLPFSVAWIMLIKRFLASISIVKEYVPEFVKRIVWLELLLFSLFPLVQSFYAVADNGARARARPLEYAGAYNVLSITAKMVLVFTVFFGLREMK